MPDTSREFDLAVSLCRDVVKNKMKDYGTAWRILRPSSLTDQIFIKAQRIRTIENSRAKKVDEGIKSEFIGIVNYSVMALIQLELGDPLNDEYHLDEENMDLLYLKYVSKAKSLMDNKNHDYSEAWRDMRISSLTDIILMKLLRIKQIEDHQGNTFVSEGLDANYLDIINYAVFALIRIMETGEPQP